MSELLMPRAEPADELVQGALDYANILLTSKERLALREWALDYQRLGWSIFPLEGKAPSKKFAKQGFNSATTDYSMAELWTEEGSPVTGIGFEPGTQGLVVIDVDGRNGGFESLVKLEAERGPLPRTATTITPGGGTHYFYNLPPGVTIKSRNNAFGSGLPGIDVKSTGGYVAMPGSLHPNGGVYRWDVEAERESVELSQPWLEHMQQAQTTQSNGLSSYDASSCNGELRMVPSGEGHDYLRDRLFAMRRQGDGEALLRVFAYKWRDTQYEHPELYPDNDLETLIGSTMNRIEPDEVIEVASTAPLEWESQRSWPTLGEAALYGIAGDFVHKTMDHSEADSAAILSQFLCAFGIAAGPSAHFAVGATKHSARINVILVGSTSRGRKGQSWSEVKRVLRLAYEDWANTAIFSGLSSGEGVIANFADKITTVQTPEGDIYTTTEVEKCGLIIEQEFARVLQVKNREGNTLSAVIRELWDSGQLQVMTRKDPLIAQGVHAGIIGHITRDELSKLVSSTDVANGLVNRFLPVLTKRGQKLPHGGGLTDEHLAPIASRLRERIDFARTVGAMSRTPEANTLWEEFYLSAPEPEGLLGEATARAEAQVLRLSIIYALLDGRDVIDVDHLRAALALWDYVFASSQHIFGESLGDDIADRVRTELRDAYPEGIDGSDLHKRLGGHISAKNVKRALATLVELGLAKTQSVKTDGRPRKIAYAVRRE